MWPKMWSILENVACALEKKAYYSAFWCNVLKISMRFISSHLMYHLRCISLLTFCFDNLSIGVSGVLKCPTIILLLQFLLLCLLVFVLCFEVFLCWVYRYLKLCVILLDLSLDHYVVSVLISCNFFILRSMLSDTWIATPAFFFLLYICMKYFSILSLSVNMCL